MTIGNGFSPFNSATAASRALKTRNDISQDIFAIAKGIQFRPALSKRPYLARRRCESSWK